MTSRPPSYSRATSAHPQSSRENDLHHRSPRLGKTPHAFGSVREAVPSSSAQPAASSVYNAIRSARVKLTRDPQRHGFHLARGRSALQRARFRVRPECSCCQACTESRQLPGRTLEPAARPDAVGPHATDAWTHAHMPCTRTHTHTHTTHVHSTHIIHMHATHNTQHTMHTLQPDNTHACSHTCTHYTQHTRTHTRTHMHTPHTHTPRTTPPAPLSTLPLPMEGSWWHVPVGSGAAVTTGPHHATLLVFGVTDVVATG